MTVRYHEFVFFAVGSLCLQLAWHLGNAQPYAISWVNLKGVSASGNFLTRSVTIGGWGAAGAISSNLLPSSADGYIEFTATTGDDYILGFSRNDIINYNDFSYCIFIDQNTNTANAIEDGSAAILLTTFQTGDVFKISREGSVINYYKNDNILRSVSTVSAYVLNAKVCIRTKGKSTPNILLSFDRRLTVPATINVSDGIDNLSSITTTTRGGTPPYSYEWSTGEVTPSIAGKSHGQYSLTVTDAESRSQTRTYEIGYDISWINPLNVNNSGGVLTRTIQSGSWGSSGAISSNILATNTDGWMEFVAATGSDYIIGFSENNNIAFDAFTHALFIDDNTNSVAAVEFGAVTNLGNFETGDVFRIAREANADSIKYYRNGVVIRSVKVDRGNELKIKASIQVPSASTPRISASFDRVISLLGYVNGLHGNTGSGSINLSVSGGTAPYAYAWSSGETSGSVSNKQRGKYTLDVLDALGRSVSRDYSVGYEVEWTNLIGVSLANGILTKTSINGNWGSGGGTSTNILRPQKDGWIEFTIVNGADFRIGLTNNDVVNFSTFSASIFVDQETGSAYASEGLVSTPLGNVQTGDMFRIAREGEKIRYYRNGQILRTISTDLSESLKVKASLQVKGSSTPKVNVSFWKWDGVVRTFHSIANGDWTDPSVWSLTESGPPATNYPGDMDNVIIKGHEVAIGSLVEAGEVFINSIDRNTRLRIEGNHSSLIARKVFITKMDDNGGGDSLLVTNNGSLNLTD